MPFLCTAFDFDSADLLFDELKVSAIKIGSAEVTNLPFLEYIGSRKSRRHPFHGREHAGGSRGARWRR